MKKIILTVSFVVLAAVMAPISQAVPPATDDKAAEKAVGDDVVMKALVDEMGRSMTLQLEKTKSPYFVEYAVSDRTTHRIDATCGAIVSSDDGKSRRMATSVRVGYYDMDNTNFAGGGGGAAGGRRGIGGGGGGLLGGMATLPLDDNYAAIRQAAWLSTDGVYKSAVETLARKQSYMEGQQQEEKRPADFARVDPVVRIDAKVQLSLDVPAWERRLRNVSAQFLNHKHVLDSQVSLTASADNDYLINSEGTRVRQGSDAVALTISAQAQAADGAPLSEIVTRYAQNAKELPSDSELAKIVDDMAGRLKGRQSAPKLDHFMGPVLFEGDASPQFFEAMLAPGITGRPEPVGGGRRRFAGVESLDRYIGKRIFPTEFQVYDDPRIEKVGDEYLAGHYEIDDEGVPAERVNVVVDGKLEGMLMSRAPTTNFDKSNGHGRNVGLGRSQAALGCLFIHSTKSETPEALHKALLDQVKDQKLEFGLRITAVSRGGGGGRAALAGRGRGGPGGGGAGGAAAGGGSSVSDPIAIFKVYPDGREELVRGCEFGSIEVSALKNIIAAGKEPVVLNTRGGLGSGASIIAPAVLFEDMELFKVEEEPQRLPIVPAPHQRAAG